MSTIVYHQAVQSCFETQIIETTTLKLKVAAHKSIESVRTSSLGGTDSMEVRDKCSFQEPNKQNLYSGGWSFLQSLCNISPVGLKEPAQKETPYVHPLARKSPSTRLSEKSLELCTENLGSETGTDIMESSIFPLISQTAPAAEESVSKHEKQSLPPQPVESKNFKGTITSSSHQFPPPLTTIRGGNSLQIRPHREGGRLIIKAMEAPLKKTYFQADRSNGRLRLCFLKEDYASNFDSPATQEENFGAESEDIENEGYESDMNDNQGQLEDEEFEEEGEEECEEEYNTMNKDMDENIFDFEVENGMEKCQRLSRCKEGENGNRGLCNWKPLWVATS